MVAPLALITRDRCLHTSTHIKLHNIISFDQGAVNDPAGL